MFLPDINFWLALTFEVHVHHARAKESFNNDPAGRFFFCRFAQLGFIRIACNAKAFGEEAVSLREAWRLYDTILSDPRVETAAEPSNLEQYWRHYTDVDSLSPNLSGDAYLAAFGRAADLQLITFDQAFRQFRGLNCLIL